MSNTLSKVLIFVAGAAVGSAVTYKIAKDRYEKIMKEDTESLKKEFGIIGNKKEEECVEEVDEEEPEEEYSPTVEDRHAVAEIISTNGYTSYSLTPEEIAKKMEDVEKPYVIPPEEYGELYDYDTIELTYYADGILADDGNEPIDDIEGVVGYEALRSFGQYEDDSVHVRNDVLKADYEILLTIENYSDAVSIGPRGSEVE